MNAEDLLYQRWEAVVGTIEEAVARSGREVGSVTLLPASKKQSIETLRSAMELGMDRFGENRVQEALAKAEALPGSVRWDLIGSLQTNKAKHAVRLFEWIHSVDRISLVDELEKRAGQIGKQQKILLEVNVSGESSKQGAAMEEVDPLLERIGEASHLECHGLMAMAPFVDDPEKARPYFVRLRELRDEKAESWGWALPELSMGMSNDYAIAIEEGATLVRVGTALFGER